MSDIKKNIYSKLLEVQKECLTFEKKGKSHFGDYLTLDALLLKLIPVLTSKDLVITHYTKDSTVVTEIYDTATNTRVWSTFPIQSGLESQKVGSAISYGKRYNIGQLLNIVTDKDDDGDSSSPVNTGKKTSKDVANDGSEMQDANGMVCEECGTPSKTSPKSGKLYCPKFKQHIDEKTFIPQVTESDYERNKKFTEGMEGGL